MPFHSAVNSASGMKPWQDRFVVALLWLLAIWVAWDFLECIDPPVPRDLVAHPLRISPRGVDTHP